jgi:hypothetical protein
MHIRAPAREKRAGRTRSPRKSRYSPCATLAPVLRAVLLGMVTCSLWTACRAAPGAADPAPAKVVASSEWDDIAAQDVAAALDELYRAFCFDPGGEPDWEGMRTLFADGAVFVAPISAGREVQAVGVDEFFADFRAYAASEPVVRTGLHERIVHRRIDLFGNVAHAFVTFEGFVPGERAARTRGLDSLQWVRDRERWRLVSFTTQYETDGLPMPRRFLALRCQTPRPPSMATASRIGGECAHFSPMGAGCSRRG